MSSITLIRARQILDSRGNPTVQVDITLSDGSFGRASVPSGASTGSHEVLELRDHEKSFDGLGVTKAIAHTNTLIAQAIVGKEFTQQTLDATLIALDGTENKSNLGANAILGVSLAFAHAAAHSAQKPLWRYFADTFGVSLPSLPRPMANVLNGGKHALHSTDIQEFMIVPIDAPFSEGLQKITETFHALKSVLVSDGQSTLVGDEGGFAPSLPSNQAALDLLVTAIRKAGYVPGKDIGLAIDVAATELYRDGAYTLAKDNIAGDATLMIDTYKKWIGAYPIISIEDGLAEDDWSGWTLLTKELGATQLVGDDLFVTSVARIQKGIDAHAANAVLIKPNQIGTLTETASAVALAKQAGYKTIISHRSGETEDTTIADLAVGLDAGQIKAGSLSRGERTAKYNRLLQIEEELG
ncbi:MAG: phosphopyruvate hydratase [Candidatus Paceibacterota bacterium]